jgi:hypothetical protein
MNTILLGLDFPLRDVTDTESVNSTWCLLFDIYTSRVTEVRDYCVSTGLCAPSPVCRVSQKDHYIPLSKPKRKLYPLLEFYEKGAIKNHKFFLNAWQIPLLRSRTDRDMVIVSVYKTPPLFFKKGPLIQVGHCPCGHGDQSRPGITGTDFTNSYMKASLLLIGSVCQWTLLIG